MKRLLKKVMNLTVTPTTVYVPLFFVFACSILGVTEQGSALWGIPLGLSLACMWIAAFLMPREWDRYYQPRGATRLTEEQLSIRTQRRV